MPEAYGESVRSPPGTCREPTGSVWVGTASGHPRRPYGACLHWSDSGLPAGASVAQAWRCRSLPGSAPRRRCTRSPREPVALPPDIHAARMVLAYNGRTTGCLPLRRWLKRGGADPSLARHPDVAAPARLGNLEQCLRTSEWSIQQWLRLTLRTGDPKHHHAGARRIAGNGGQDRDDEAIQV